MDPRPLAAGPRASVMAALAVAVIVAVTAMGGLAAADAHQAAENHEASDNENRDIDHDRIPFSATITGRDRLMRAAACQLSLALRCVLL